MQFKLSISTVLSLLALEASAFWRLPCQDRVALQRVDPLVYPGEIAGHVHSIHGSNAFSKDATTEDLMKGTCSSCQVKEDLSAYWTPAMYFKHANGQFELVPQTGGMLVYYLQRGKDVKAFPPGFRMLAGDPYLRDFPYREIEKSLWQEQDRTQDALRQKAVGYNCLNYAAPANAALGLRAFPKDMAARCRDGLRAEVFFPSCWDGKNLDSPDHKSHIVYPDLMDDGNCPPSHPVRLVSLFFETIWHVAKFNGKPGEFVFSTGDPTGYGNHGDFMNGWKQDVLERAVKECTSPSGIVEECGAFSHYTVQQMQQCKAKPDVNEDTIGPLAKLPGCNNVEYGPARAAKSVCDDQPPINLPNPSLPSVELPKLTLPTVTEPYNYPTGIGNGGNEKPIEVPTTLTTSTTELSASPTPSPKGEEKPKEEKPKEENPKKKNIVVVTVTSTTTVDVYGSGEPTLAPVKRHNHHHLEKRVGHQHHRS